MKKMFLLASAFLFIGILFLSQSVSLAGTDVFSEVCTGQADATVCKAKQQGASDNPLFGPDGVLTRAIGILSLIIGIVAIFVLIGGGLKFITSGSNAQDVVKARETIIYAIVGLIIALLAQVVVQFFLKQVN